MVIEDTEVRPDGPSRAAFDRELAAAVDAARAAGEAIRAVYGGSHEIAYKVGDDPLTVADRAADRIIHERLSRAFPGDGWLSEEDGAAANETDSGRTWVVDPLDGTREFIQHIPEFSVSIALLAAGHPVVAVVYNPIRDIMVTGVRGGGVQAQGRPATTSHATDLGAAVVLASRSEVKRGQWARFEDRFQVVPTGSVAYKMALVAIGEADATFSVAPKHGWDICAGALLVEEAGGQVSLLDGAPLGLSRPAELIDGLIASNADLHHAILAAIEATRPAASAGDPR